MPTAPLEPPPAPDDARPSRVGRVVITVIVVGMVSMWGYVLYLAIGPGRAGSPDELDDPAFAAAAEARCSEALDLVAGLQPANEAQSAAERSVALAEANEHFAAMLDDLDGLVPGGEDGEIAMEWLADWRTYLGDREDYATALTHDPGARLFVSAKGGQQVTDYIDQFAQDNRMPACSTPADAAERPLGPISSRARRAARARRRVPGSTW